jgi:hypothetical protein
VGTAGRKLFRAESVNRVPGARLPEGTCVTDTFGRKLCSQVDAEPAIRLEAELLTIPTTRASRPTSAPCFLSSAKNLSHSDLLSHCVLAAGVVPQQRVKTT